MQQVNVSKENTILGKFFNIFIVFVLAPLVRLIWIKKINGLEKLPKKGPFIVVANHQSYFDFISLISVFPFKLTFLAAEKFYNSRFWKPIMEYTGQIKVDRKAKNKDEVIEKGLEVLNAGGVLAIFPQGTRSRNSKIEKVYIGVAKLALQAKVPIVPIGIKGAFKVMSPQVNKPILKKIIKINIGEILDFSEFYSNKYILEQYIKVTDLVMKEVSDLCGKKYKTVS